MTAHWHETWDDNDLAVLRETRRLEAASETKSPAPNADAASAQIRADGIQASAANPLECDLGDEVAELVRPAAARYCGDVRGCVRMWQGLEQKEQRACYIETFRDVIVPDLPTRVRRIDAAYLPALTNL